MQTFDFTDIFQQAAPFPVLGTSIPIEAYLRLDLSVDNPDFAHTDVHTYEGLETYIRHLLQASGAQVGYGGYNEHRIFYHQSPLFNDGTTPPRCIHLGVDMWLDAGAPVYAPLDGQVHSLAFNNQLLDYGMTVILEHELQGNRFWTLYGHLALGALENLQVGQRIKKEHPFAAIGARHENGGWVPHLHWQIILDLQGHSGDFPGVATITEAPSYLQICPDPALLAPSLL